MKDGFGKRWMGNRISTPIQRGSASSWLQCVVFREPALDTKICSQKCQTVKALRFAVIDLRHRLPNIAFLLQPFFTQAVI